MPPSTKQLFFIAQAFEALARELADCQSARQAQLQCESLEKRLQLGLGRLICSSMCPRCRDGFSGANKRHDAAQRVYREAVVFTVSGKPLRLWSNTCQVSAF